MRHKCRKRRNKLFLTVLGLILLAAILAVLYLFGIIPSITFNAEHFGLETAISSVDFNGNGNDDYKDFLLGAKKDAENHPTYDGSYYAGGYPPDHIGVCTDVVWRAFKTAGYSLRDMVDQDIRNRPDAYTHVSSRDKNIDFRRVGNLYDFFSEYAVELTTDINDIDEWQPGDIVFFGNGQHIGIVSDIRNFKGQTYIIHNGGQPIREEDLFRRAKPTAHFRFDSSQIDTDILIAWSD